MLKLPFFSELEDTRRVLLAGAGGGYDVFCTLPLYFALRDAGKEVFLASLSFTRVDLVGGGTWVTPSLLEVNADCERPPHINYFPEGYLSRWFRSIGSETPIYCFERTGVKPLLAGYRALTERLKLDTIVLVDGGTDSLMRGDEFHLATPQEDIASIASVDDVEVARKLLVCVGFGIDHFHGICHAQFLEAVAELIQAGGYLGTFSLLNEMKEVQLYRAACDYVFAQMPNHPSIVSSSILSALAGHYGDHHATTRTQGSTLWINPLMPLCWCFRLDAVARRILYLDAMKQTEDYGDVCDGIELFRSRIAHRPWQDIPV
jgi:hypothetical protein